MIQDEESNFRRGTQTDRSIQLEERRLEDFTQNTQNPISHQVSPEMIQNSTTSATSANENLEGCKDLDDVIACLGTNTKYQRRLLLFAISPISAVQAILVYNAVFMFFTPDHWCSHPEEQTFWGNPEEYKLVNIPMINGTDGKYSSCSMLASNQSEINCQFGWEYDKTDYEQTMASEYGWVCDKANIPTYALLSSTGGNAVGLLVFGILSDVKGRKPALFLAILLNVICRIGSLFVGSYWYLLCILQFFAGWSHTAIYLLPSLIAAELSNKDDRAEVYATTWTICLVGLAVLPVLSWLCGNWFLIGITTVGFGVITLFYYPVVPESPRWLLQNGKIDEAVSVLKTIQECNSPNKKLEDHVLYNMLQSILDKQRSSENGNGAFKGRFKASVLFTKRSLAKNTSILTVCWAINSLIYATMTYNAMHMSGSHFKNFFLLAIIEVPSGFIGGYLADTLGRRWTQVLAFFVCTLGCFSTSIVVHNIELEVLFATFTKLAVTVSFLVVYLQATEIFPTELRSTGSGIASTIASFVAISAPIIAKLSTTNASYPWILMGILSVVGMIASSFLPETLNVKLPETVEEAENIGKKVKFWSITPAPSLATSKNPISTENESSTD